MDNSRSVIRCDDASFLVRARYAAGLRKRKSRSVNDRLRILQALCTWPEFSFTSYRMVDSLRRQGIAPQTVIDVGANVGQFAVAAMKLLAPNKLYAFEPIPEVCQKLKRNTASIPQVEASELALAEAAGSRQFHLNSHSHSSSLLPLAKIHREAFPDACEVRTFEVGLSTLDQFFAEIDLGQPVLLKLDVQGYEANVIKGGKATLRKLQWVVAETSLRPLYEGEPLFIEFVEMMAEAGFRFLRPVGSHTDPRTGEILQLDALFERM